MKLAIVFIILAQLPMGDVFIAGAGGAYPSSPIYMPSDAGAVNVKTNCGAKGDGTTDDTAAIQSCIQIAMGHSGTVYFPDSTYLISAPLMNKSGSNWTAYVSLQGQSKANTIIKLKDSIGGSWASPGTCDISSSGTPNCVNQTMIYFGSGNNSFFDGNGNEGYNLYISDMTINMGSGNAGAEGIHWVPSNSASLNNLLIKSNDGTCFAGVDERTQYVGPGLLKNVEVDGCEYAFMIQHGFSSATIEHATFSGQSIASIWNRGNQVSVRDLKVINTPLVANVLASPSGESIAGANGALVIIGGAFTGTSASPAISYTSGAGGGQVYLRNITSSGFAGVVSGQGNSITEFSSSSQVPGGSPGHSLLLPIQDPPEFNDVTPADWANVQTYGAIGNGSHNDAPNVQAAIDSGKLVIYFPNGTYLLGSQVLVRSSVCMLQGFGGGASLTVSGSYVPFKVQSTTCPAGSVTIRGFTGQGGGVEGANGGVTVLRDFRLMNYFTSAGFTGGLIFLEDVSFGSYSFTGQTAWCIQCNPENGPLPGTPCKICNNGGKVWILGLKTENPGGGNTPSPVVLNTNAASTEVLGGYIGTQQQTGNITGDPMFINNASRLSAFAVSDFHTWDPALREISTGTTDTGSSSYPTRGNGSPAYWFMNSFLF